MKKEKLLSYLDLASTAIISLTVFLLPVVFLTNSTDFFIIPKQILVLTAALILLVLWGVKSIIETKIVISINPFIAPVSAFGLIIFASSIFSKNRFDSLFQSVPIFLTIILFFLITNLVKNKKSINIIVGTLLLGAGVASLISILYFLNVFFLPFPSINSRYFNPFGSSIQQIAYTIPLLAIVLYGVLKKLNFPKFKINTEVLKKDYFLVLELFTLVSLLGGLIAIILQIALLPQKPIVLPYAYGLQTAFAAISQDASRFLQSLFFGSGYGTFLVDFTRFRLPSFNLEPSIWNLSFSYSSSYFLELIATTGILGAIAFLSILVMAIKNRSTKNPLFFSIFLAFAASFLIPFSFTVVALLFVILGLYTASLYIEKDKRVYDIGIIALPQTENKIISFVTRAVSLYLSAILMIVILIFVAIFGFFSYNFTVSDFKFAKSLQAANANNAQVTYQLQTQAIQAFPYRSDYHRIFSQINLAIANSLVSNNPNPNQQIQQNIVSLLQQSIASGRNAATLSPSTSQNWQSLSNIYRNLINVGQNADQFAIATLNQAITLDPYNPQLYIQLGGIYYQLGQFEAAQTQFQTAVNLKKDFANAYYNLGHALESKGDLQNALSVYQIVKQLVKDDAANLKKIDEEIKALEAKAGEASKPAANVEKPTKNQPALDVNTPSVTLPPQKPPIKISPPPSEDEPTPTGTPTATPSPTPAE